SGRGSCRRRQSRWSRRLRWRNEAISLLKHRRVSLGTTVVTDYRLLPAGDTALTVEFGDRIDRQCSNLVLGVARCLTEANITGVVECVPTFRSLTVYYDPLLLPCGVLRARIARLMQGLHATDVAGRHW